ncbi:MAG: ATP-dependent Clp protease proteolytic subunit, partial [Clostridia bacterium]|nr:ATP-dependent Clp protease proteolytic subunit [Clostridia bacterium]
MDKQRIVFLNGEVDTVSAMEVIMQLLSFEDENDATEIRLYINSNGGSIPAGLAIYDTIQL